MYNHLKFGRCFCGTLCMRNLKVHYISNPCPLSTLTTIKQIFPAYYVVQLHISQLLMYHLFKVILVYLMSVSLLSLQIFAIKFTHVVLKHEDCRKTKAPLEVCFG